MIRKITNKQKSNDKQILIYNFQNPKLTSLRFDHWQLEFEIYLGLANWDLGFPFRG